MKSVDDIILKHRYVTALGIIGGRQKTYNEYDVREMLKEYALEVIDEIIENRDEYFYTKMGTEDINVEGDMVVHLKQQIEEQ